MEKAQLIAEIEDLKYAVQVSDISTLIGCIDHFHIDLNFLHSPIAEFTHELLEDAIFKHVSQKGKLRVKRKGEYGNITYDTYLIEDEVLKRNGTDVKFTSIGKLYQAYKTIKKI